MKKLGIVFILLLLLCGCSKPSVYTDKQQEMLKEMNVLDVAEKDCINTDSVKLMLESGDFDPTYIKDYCRIPLTNSQNVNFLLSKQASDEDILGYSEIDYFREENYDRYQKTEGSYEEKVVHVNLDLDIEPFEITHMVEDYAPDKMLVNKFYALPEDYEPNDLVGMDHACVNGVDYSCTTASRKLLQRDANDAFNEFVEAAKQEMDIDIVAIGTYRTVQYQRDLYNYYLPIYGQEKTDQFYARPGQSEHNSGYAVDISFDHIPYTEIENYSEPYQWILENMHEYGFILRYPKDKQHLTRYGYESWHLRYVGKEVASVIYENNWCLEEYFARIK